MKYYFLQIKEGPHGGPFYDCVNKWISAGYAAVFTKDPLGKIQNGTTSLDVINFINTLKTKENDDSILVSIGTADDGIDYIFIYKKAGKLEEISSLSVNQDYYKNCNYVDRAIGFKIDLIKKNKNCRLSISSCYNKILYTSYNGNF